MPALKPISREYRIYLALWRKAYLQPEGAPTISIKCSSLHMAIAMRQGMYRAIKPYRNGLQTDEELRQAAEKFVIYLVKAEHHTEPHFLELRERKALSELEAELAELGIGEDDLLVGDERSADKMLNELANAPKEEPVKTSFYER